MMINFFNKILEKQHAFQKLVGVNIDSKVEEDRLLFAEIFITKGIEEFVELRRTFPSILNKASKSQPRYDRQVTLKEWVDVFLFWTNIGLVFEFTEEELFNTIKEVQDNNFFKFKERQMAILNHEILRSPAPVVGIGGGHLMPDFIFVGQNPAQTMTRVFYSVNEGSGKILLDILDDIGVRDRSYFTNLVKETTPNNAEPPDDMVLFWKSALKREISLLKEANEGAVVVPIGKFTSKHLDLPGIHHPSYVMRGGMSEEAYREEVQEFLRESLERRFNGQ
jgi:uracil-DNA glycosylase